MAGYEPMKVSLGALPEFHEEVKSYDLKVGGQIPAEAKEVFVYTFVTTNGEGPFQRGYYEIFTKKGDKEYTQYMNVATGQGVKAVNSANMWLPIGEGKVTVKLVHAEGPKKSIKSEEHKDWSELFVIGYK